MNKLALHTSLKLHPWFLCLHAYSGCPYSGQIFSCTGRKTLGKTLYHHSHRCFYFHFRLPCANTWPSLTTLTLLKSSMTKFPNSLDLSFVLSQANNASKSTFRCVSIYLLNRCYYFYFSPFMAYDSLYYCSWISSSIVWLEKVSTLHHVKLMMKMTSQSCKVTNSYQYLPPHHFSPFLLFPHPIILYCRQACDYFRGSVSRHFCCVLGWSAHLPSAVASNFLF